MGLELWVFVCKEEHFLADRRLDLAKNELGLELKFHCACNLLYPMTTSSLEYSAQENSSTK